jgi:hypothetical protein
MARLLSNGGGWAVFVRKRLLRLRPVVVPAHQRPGSEKGVAEAAIERRLAASAS